MSCSTRKVLVVEPARWYSDYILLFSELLQLAHCTTARLEPIMLEVGE